MIADLATATDCGLLSSSLQGITLNSRRRSQWRGNMNPYDIIPLVDRALVTIVVSILNLIV